MSILSRCFMIFLLVGGCSAFASDRDLSAAEQQIFQLANQARKDAGVEPLQWNEQAAQAARTHAKLMAAQHALSHQFRGEPALRDRMGATGLRFDAAAENVADAVSAEEAHDALMHSPPHRENLLNPKYNALGVGVAEKDGQLYVVQDFAHAISAQTAEQVEDGIISDFNRLRTSHGLAPVQAAKSAELRKLACNGKQQPVRARDVLAANPNANRVFAFTLTDPTKLPQSLLEASHDQVRRMNVGACFTPSAATSYAAFSVAVTMYQ